MGLKPLTDTLPRLKVRAKPELEDAWLNDVGPSLRHQPDDENDHSETLSGLSPEHDDEIPASEVDTYTLVDHAELLSLQNTSISQILPSPQQTTLVDQVLSSGLAIESGLYPLGGNGPTGATAGPPPYIHSTPAPTGHSPADSKTEHLPVDSKSSLPITAGHRLWPLLLHLSERIWQESHQKVHVTPHPPHSARYVGSATTYAPHPTPWDAINLVPTGSLRSQTPERHPLELVEFVRSRALELLREEPALAVQVRDLAEAEQLLQAVVEEVLGYGPLAGLLESEDISEITVIGPRLIYVVRDGKLEEASEAFEEELHMRRTIENMLQRAGQHLEASWPMAMLCLSGGASVNIVMPPLAVHGPTISIRKRAKRCLSMAELVQLGSLTQEMADFLIACVQARLNIVVCGGVGSGRTMLLNALSTCIPAEERVVTIEEYAELQVGQKQRVALQSWLTEPGSKKRIEMRDLLLQALQMRPGRLIVGECHGSEVVELLQAMYTGCSGVLTTVYAHNLRDCLTRLEVMCLVGSANLPITTIRAQMVGALDVVVYVSRLRDGSHKVMNIAEVQGLEGDNIRLQSIFHYENMEEDTETGKLQGIFRAGGFRPRCLGKFEALNIRLPREMFAAQS